MSKENKKLTEAAAQNIEASKEMNLSEKQLEHVVGGKHHDYDGYARS